MNIDGINILNNNVTRRETGIFVWNDGVGTSMGGTATIDFSAEKIEGNTIISRYGISARYHWMGSQCEGESECHIGSFSISNNDIISSDSGIRVAQHAAVLISDSQATANGVRNSGTPGFDVPADISPMPGDGIRFTGRSTGFVVDTEAANNAGPGIVTSSSAEIELLNVVEFNNYIELKLTPETDSQSVLKQMAERVRIRRFEITGASLYDIFIDVAGVKPEDIKAEGGGDE